jgi:hypothetical protein
MAVVQPVNYGIATAPANPAQSIMSGLQVGQGLGDALVIEPAVAQAKANQARMDMAQQQLMAQDLAAAKTPQAVAQLAVKYPQLAEKLKVGLQGLSDQEKTALIEQAQPVYAAALQGDTKAAADMLRRNAQAWRNSGNEARAKAMEDNAALVEANPEAAKTTMGLFLAQQMGPDKFEATYGTLAMQPAKTREAEAQADVKTQEALIKAEEAKIAAQQLAAQLKLTEAQAQRLRDQSAIESRRLGLEERELSERVAARLDAARRADIEISEKQQGLMTDAALSAEVKTAEADKAAEVVSAFRTAERDTVSRISNEGIVGSGREIASRVAGTEGPMTQARLKYMQLVDDDIQRRAKESGNKLTDEDYRQQRKLYPDPEGNFGLVAKWAEDFEAKTRRAAAIDDAKAQWIAQNGGLGPAKAPMSIGGVVVGTGSTLQDVMKQISKTKPTASRRSARGQQPGFVTKYEAP